MPFFTFNQNNSGGSFVFEKDRGITHFVIIEAANAYAAKIEAIMHGIYFDGCAQGIDCFCCGDRWPEPLCEKGDEVPMLYGNPIGQPQPQQDFAFLQKSWMSPNPEGIIHYADGRRQWFDAEGMPIDF